MGVKFKLTQREEHRLSTFENKQRRERFDLGSNRRTEKLCNLCSSLNFTGAIKSKKRELAAHETRMVEMKNAYKILNTET
jgi:hypothetical protein